MERVAAEDHPLSSPENNVEHYASFSSNNGPGPSQQRSPAASLIQSAARSILDDGTPSSAVSDDGSESCSGADGTLGPSRTPASPTLASLQIETMPALPDEKDRKRFVVSIFLYCWILMESDEFVNFLISGILIYTSSFSIVINRVVWRLFSHLAMTMRKLMTVKELTIKIATI
jgi:hypothetical protein